MLQRRRLQSADHHRHTTSVCFWESLVRMLVAVVTRTERADAQARWEASSLSSPLARRLIHQNVNLDPNWN